jgi:hypothetical protein
VAPSATEPVTDLRIRDDDLVISLAAQRQTFRDTGPSRDPLGFGSELEDLDGIRDRTRHEEVAPVDPAKHVPGCAGHALVDRVVLAVVGFAHENTDEVAERRDHLRDGVLARPVDHDHLDIVPSTHADGRERLADEIGTLIGGNDNRNLHRFWRISGPLGRRLERPRRLFPPAFRPGTKPG